MFTSIDIGASSTRFMTNKGKPMILPNNMVFLDRDAMVDLYPNDSKIESALEIVITKEGDESGLYEKKVLIGEMAERYSATNIRPSMSNLKHRQPINFYSGIVAAAVSRIYDKNPAEMDLYVAFPPGECNPEAKKTIANNFNGKYEVFFVKLNTKVMLNIENTYVLPESYMAMMSYFFSINGQVNEKAKNYLRGQVLSLDIGASTTDLAIIKDGKYIDRSGFTFRLGGNFVRDTFVHEISNRLGYNLPNSQAEQAVAEGRIQSGDTYKDVSDVVDMAKKAFADSLASSINSYFIQNDIPLASIRAIIVSGGGSMEGQYVTSEGNIVKTSKAMSQYITDALKTYCKDIVVEGYGDNPRMANVTGLTIRAAFAEAQKKNAPQVQATAHETPAPVTI